MQGPEQDPKGISIETFASGSRYKGRDDLLLVSFADKAGAAGLFTRSRCPSAAVEWCQDRLRASNRTGALLVNAGNANAFTGGIGKTDCATLAQSAARRLALDPQDILIASTGVIGEPLEVKDILSALDRGGKSANWLDAAQAIMTTDSAPKVARASFAHHGQRVPMVGIAKGSGMIAPDMATMLAFVFTDLPVDPGLCDAALRSAARQSFNRITVDSDTSTSDSLILFATGARQCPPVLDAQDPAFRSFCQALDDLCADLAKKIVCDAEGARKMIVVRVLGAEDDRAADVIARAIANSPLVKTAIHGEDANWGRVVMAVGKAGEAARRDRLAIRFGPHDVARKGQRSPTYDEEALSAYMKTETIEITVSLGIGAGRAEIWGCDLSADYVRINAGYRS